MVSQAEGSTPSQSIESFFKAANHELLAEEDGKAYGKDSLPVEVAVNKGTLSPETKNDSLSLVEAETKDKDHEAYSSSSSSPSGQDLKTPKPSFNASDLSVRSKFTAFFCKPRTVKTGKVVKSPQKADDIVLVSDGLKIDLSSDDAITIDIDDESEEVEPSPKSPKLTNSSSSDSVVCVQVLPAVSAKPVPAPSKPVKIDMTARPGGEKTSFSSLPEKQPLPTKVKSALPADLSSMDPILQAAFLKRQAQLKTTNVVADKTAAELSVLFKLVPKVDPPRANPLFIRTRLDDTFGMLKAKAAKELRLSPEILVLVYDGVALFDSSKPSTLNLLGTKQKVSDKKKAIELTLFTKSTWHQEQQMRVQKRQTFLENVQFLNQTITRDDEIDDDSLAGEEEAFFSQPSSSAEPEALSISIRTNKTGIQIFNVQVPKSGKVSDIVERFKALQALNTPITNVKVKFDGDLLPLNADIASILENEDMIDFTL